MTPTAQRPTRRYLAIRLAPALAMAIASAGVAACSSPESEPEPEPGIEPEAAASEDAQPAPEVAVRHFEFVYRIRVADLPDDAQSLDLWVPYPRSDESQDIEDGRVECIHPYVINHEDEYGNRVFHVHLEGDDIRDEVAATLTFRVTRRENVRNAFAGHGDAPLTAEERERVARYLQPDALVPVDGSIGELAATIAPRETNQLAIARAIYDYVLATMTYSKEGTGWGRGDAVWACDSRYGNCTDFHALFCGLVRARGIAARFSIGFPLPRERGEGEVAGYHCWAEFYLPGYGFVPVDISEADKHPELAQYYFGAHSEDRIQFSRGRDLLLNPAQRGERLNYFIYPYVEVDGLPHATIERSFRFRDL